jgi:tRNA nucleotidyltransferase (CCA-adding enzyme)
VTGSRLGAELRLLLREPQPAALLALERHGLGRALLGDGFRVDPDLVWHAQALTPPDGRTDLVALAATLDGGRRDIAAKLDDLAFPAAERNVVAHAAASAGYLTDVLDPRDGAMTDAELWRALRKQSPETVALAGASGDAATAANARRWLDDVRHRRLAITGDDIVAAGLYGPRVGEALEAATEAMLAGEAAGREEQLAAALRGRA